MAYGHTPLFPHVVRILSERQSQNRVVDQRLYHYTLCGADVFKHRPSSDGLIVVSDGVDLCRHLANLNDIPFELSDVEITLEQRSNLVRITFDGTLIDV